MSTDAATLAPESPFIATSAHTGTWTRRITNPNASTYTAAELASIVTHGEALDPRTGEFVIWEFVGHSDGVALFARSRYVPQTGGWLAGYDADGRHVISHPADRPIRMLVK